MVDLDKRVDRAKLAQWLEAYEADAARRAAADGVAVGDAAAVAAAAAEAASSGEPTNAASAVIALGGASGALDARRAPLR